MTSSAAERPTIRLFLVDDHEMVREGLKLMLSHYDDIDVIGEASTGREAVSGVSVKRPAVVLLDLQLPDMPGLEVLASLQELLAPPAVLVLSVHDDDDFVIGAVRLGARGYVLKHTSHEELALAIRRIADGGLYFAPEVSGALVNLDRRLQEQALLTEREREVLRLLAAGLANREIGERLYLSPDTVKTHLGNIYRKLGVEGRTQAVVVALRKKLLD
jgi:two-component system NarL family response regulator/two-component system response regulator DegU